MTEAAKPKLTLFQQVWAGWPLVLIFVGGLVGGACGGAAYGVNYRVFTSDKGTGFKYAVSLAVSVAAVCLYIFGVGLLAFIFPSVFTKR